jgi:hypothetical protein
MNSEHYRCANPNYPEKFHKISRIAYLAERTQSPAVKE